MVVQQPFSRFIELVIPRSVLVSLFRGTISSRRLELNLQSFAKLKRAFSAIPKRRLPSLSNDVMSACRQRSQSVQRRAGRVRRRGDGGRERERERRFEHEFRCPLFVLLGGFHTRRPRTRPCPCRSGRVKNYQICCSSGELT